MRGELPPMLTPDEVSDLARRRDAGDDSAVAAIVEGNVRLALKVVRPFLSDPRAERDDLIQVALIGVWRAARAFDPGRGLRFSSLAHVSARRSVMNHLDPSGRRRLRRAASLDHAGSAFSVVLADPKAVPPPSAAAAAEDRTVVAGLLRRLPARHAETVRLHFGLDGGGARTVAEVGAILGVTKTRVSQVVRVSLNKLRGAVGVPPAPVVARAAIPADVLEALRRLAVAAPSASLPDLAAALEAETGFRMSLKTVSDRLVRLGLRRPHWRGGSLPREKAPGSLKEASVHRGMSVQ